MNPAQLDNIEKRWLAASGGPWSIEKGLEIRDTTPFAMLEDPVAIAKAAKLPDLHMIVFNGAPGQTQAIAFHDWIACQADDHEPWTPAKAWERGGHVLNTISRKRYEQLADIGGRARPTPREDDCELFAFSAAALKTHAADIDFVLHAVEDVGDLVHEVRRLTGERERLLRELKTSHAESTALRAVAERAQTAVRAFVKAADAVSAVALLREINPEPTKEG